MDTEHNSGDYVLVHKTKAKISRARKMVIGFMAIGAATALAGAGTFASFSASTTNDGVFKTGRLVLSNTVTGGAGACFSSGSGVNQTATSDLNLDANDTSCGDLFANAVRPGVEATAVLTLVNASTYANANLYMFGDDGDANTTNNCTSVINDTNFSIKGTGNICSVIQMQIQEVDGPTQGASPIGSQCVYPADTALCGTNYGALTSLLTGFTGAADGRLIGAYPTSNATRYFRIEVKMPDGGFTSTGYGNDNIYQNLKPNLKLKWLIQDAA